MTLKDALGFVIDYGKFIVALWSSYIALTLAMIGWLVTLRGKEPPLDDRLRKALVGTFLAVSAIFGAVLFINHAYMVNLHKILDAIAKAEPAGPVRTIYLGVFDSSRLACALDITLYAVLPVVALLVSRLVWFITEPKG